jgi:Domain of unknown function (DUF4397)
MTYPWSKTGTFLSLALAAACTGNRTKEPVVTTTGDKTAVSEAGTTAAKRGKSLVRVVNAIPGEGAIDITGDDRTIFFDVGYKTVTPYTEIGDNVVKFKLRPGGAVEVTAENTETLMNGNRYTLIALPNKDGGAKLSVVKDDVVPDQGKARLRVFHAAPGLAEVDVLLEGQKDPVFDNLGFGSEGGFKDLDPATATVVVRRDNPPTTVLRIQKIHLEAGRAYTIVIAGAAPTSLATITITDAIRTYATAGGGQ